MLTRLNKSIKEVRIEWLRHGCPRHGNLFTRLKKAKRLFRNVHRKTVELYFVRLYNEIDKAAEINQSQFWISEADNYIHLGVTCNKYSKLGTVIDGACRSLRGNLTNIGLHPNGLFQNVQVNCFTSCHVWL